MRYYSGHLLEHRLPHCDLAFVLVPDRLLLDETDPRVRTEKEDYLDRGRSGLLLLTYDAVINAIECL